MFFSSFSCLMVARKRKKRHNKISTQYNKRYVWIGEAPGATSFSDGAHMHCFASLRMRSNECRKRPSLSSSIACYIFPYTLNCVLCNVRRGSALQPLFFFIFKTFNVQQYRGAFLVARKIRERRLLRQEKKKAANAFWCAKDLSEVTGEREEKKGPYRRFIGRIDEYA